MTALYVPPTDESDHKKQNMSIQNIAAQTSTNTTSIAALNATTYVNSIAGNNGAFTLNAASGITNSTNDIQVSQATASQFGAVKVDNSTITAASGVISVAVAAKSDQTTATSTTLEVTPGRQQFHPSASKAWVKFTGSGVNGAQTITASYNVSGVSRTSAGVYVVTLTTGFSSADYVCLVTQLVGSTNGWGQVQNGGMASGSVTVGFVTTGPTAFDPGSGMVVCFGTQ